MKLYVSADMEGLAGVRKWSQVNKRSKEYPKFRKEMIAEVDIVEFICKSALNKGVKSITIKDAHWTGRNIQSSKLLPGAKLISGWSGSPYSMMEYLNHTYDGVIFVGYHGSAGSKYNKLGHFVSTKAKRVRLNNTGLSEFRINTYIAAQEGVPVLCVLGDQEICREAKRLISKNIPTVETLSKLPCTSGNILLIREIERAVIAGLKLKPKIPKLPKVYNLEVQYYDERDMRKALKHPDVILKNENTITFKTPILNKLLVAIDAIL